MYGDVIIVAYLVLISMVMLVLTRFLPRTGLWKGIAAGAVVFTIWFSIALYSGMISFLGWPYETKFENLPDEGVLLYAVAVEPNRFDKGGFYFVIAASPSEDRSLLNPLTSFLFERGTPRYYRAPYDKDLHEKLQEAMKQMMEMEGGYMVLKKGKPTRDGKRGHRSGEDEESPFRVLNKYAGMEKDESGNCPDCE